MNRKICQHKIDLRMTMMFLFDRLDDFVLGLSYKTFSLVNEYPMNYETLKRLRNAMISAKYKCLTYPNQNIGIIFMSCHRSHEITTID